MFLERCSGPLKPIKFVGGVLTLKNICLLIGLVFQPFFKYNNHHNQLLWSFLIVFLLVLKILKILKHQLGFFPDLQLFLFVFQKLFRKENK